MNYYTHKFLIKSKHNQEIEKYYKDNHRYAVIEYHDDILTIYEYHRGIMDMDNILKDLNLYDYEMKLIIHDIPYCILMGEYNIINGEVIGHKEYNDVEEFMKKVLGCSDEEIEEFVNQFKDC